jgi:outer membrane immunogenic protein
MRRLCLAVAAVAAAFVQPVHAADMSVNAMPVKAPAAIATDWTGFYAGVSGGVGWGKSEQTDTTPFTSGQYDIKGAIIGGTLGYNRQVGPVVFGLETDFSYTTIDGSTIGTDPASGNCGSSHCESAIRSLGTLRGRIGLAWQNVMPYVTGGLAYGYVYGAEGITGAGVYGSGAEWMTGWTVGGGVEAKLAANWSVKAEYLYVDLGSKDVFTDNFFNVFFFPENLSVTAQIVRVGLNYRF